MTTPIRTQRHELVLFEEVDGFLDDFLDRLARATKRVFLEVYIFQDDDFGRLIGDALVACVARGTPVWLLYDPLGSQKTDGEFFRDLQSKGVFVRAYRPEEKVAIAGGPLPRDHARNFVVDDVAYSGGVAFAHQWLPKNRGGGGWHDVMLRVQGPVVDDYERLFRQRWSEADGGVAVPQDFCSKDRYPELELVGDTPKYDSKVFNRHVEAIERAQRRIHIVNSYYYPSKKLTQALYDAAARGVEVKIVTCGDSDLGVIKAATMGAARGWLEHGLEVHEYARCTLHAKYAVIDDGWCTVGSFNANPTSVAMANEINLFVYDRPFVARVEACFQRDLATSKKLTLEELAARGPLEKLEGYAALQALRALDFIAGPRPPRGEIR